MASAGRSVPTERGIWVIERASGSAAGGSDCYGARPHKLRHRPPWGHWRGARQPPAVRHAHHCAHRPGVRGGARHHRGPRRHGTSPPSVCGPEPAPRACGGRASSRRHGERARCRPVCLGCSGSVRSLAGTFDRRRSGRAAAWRSSASDSGHAGSGATPASWGARSCWTTPRTIIGVMPDRFAPLLIKADVWVPVPAEGLTWTDAPLCRRCARPSSSRRS